MQYHSASTMQHCPKFMTVKLSSDALFRKVLTHFRIEMPLCSSMQYACPYLDFLAFFSKVGVLHYTEYIFFAQSHYIEVAQGGFSNRAIHN